MFTKIDPVGILKRSSAQYGKLVSRWDLKVQWYIEYIISKHNPTCNCIRGKLKQQKQAIFHTGLYGPNFLTSTTGEHKETTSVNTYVQVNILGSLQSTLPFPTFITTKEFMGSTSQNLIMKTVPKNVALIS